MSEWEEHKRGIFDTKRRTRKEGMRGKEGGKKNSASNVIMKAILPLAFSFCPFRSVCLSPKLCRFGQQGGKEGGTKNHSNEEQWCNEKKICTLHSSSRFVHCQFRLVRRRVVHFLPADYLPNRVQRNYRMERKEKNMLP